LDNQCNKDIGLQLVFICLSPFLQGCEYPTPRDLSWYSMVLSECLLALANIFR